MPCLTTPASVTVRGSASQMWCAWHEYWCPGFPLLLVRWSGWRKVISAHSVKLSCGICLATWTQLIWLLLLPHLTLQLQLERPRKGWLIWSTYIWPFLNPLQCRSSQATIVKTGKTRIISYNYTQHKWIIDWDVNSWQFLGLGSTKWSSIS